ncbi:maltokinase N-terminal cap-like domain-containing protein [Nocardioides bruguierae]|uniref:maltokinase N-terminal cap-like domain-containing protein n=1 Tax=Nocardioides bruguierae TaxID=2945102 RepID=UPI002020FF1B|nr:hypothetical protein [Nocardioides bruguierae]MCL8024722.1 hypothetical protein [Nocardioides bruguierae]
MSDAPAPFTGPVDHVDPAVIADYLGRTRWFGGKGRPFEVSQVYRIGHVPGTAEGGPVAVLNHLVELTYADVPAGAAEGEDGEQAVEVYQVPLAFYTDAESRLEHAFIGWWEEPGLGWVHVYDAVHDREAMAAWQRTFFDAYETGEAHDAASGLTFRRLPGYEIDPDARASLFSGEQSNSTVMFGEDAILKVFRKLTPGRNPDIEIHEVLTRAGCANVAALYGWIDWTHPRTGEIWQLSMLQQFLRTASDGWDLALNSVRTLFSDPETRASASGGDFAGEATRLGEALREVHDTLAEHFGTSEKDAGALAALMGRRLGAAAAVVPVLEEHREGLLRTFGAVADQGLLTTQRVHGDLHLGQTLRTSLGWKIVDFEGEPAKTLAERVLPDSPWRDVAGMLRSFDYAPRVVERTWSEDDPEGTEARQARAAEWANRAKNHFLVAYTGGEVTEAQRTLLDAYVADKAVYETVYETRNRPTWVDIPLQAVAEIGES